ncbi:MAG: hypothetical protein U0L85_05200 [Bacilli bacterium]|nr:hypothetical protein [Bacilli bacterium]
MNKEENTFLELFSMIGYFIGFGLILYYSLFNNTNHILLAIGLVFILGFRFLGYGLDLILKRNNKKNAKKR